MPIVSTSTAAFFDRARQNIADLRSRAEGIQSQLGSGQRLARSSDDPVAASRMRALTRLDSLAEIDTANAGRASADLSLVDGALAEFANLTTRASELAQQAANGTMTADQRTAIAQELDGIGQSLFTLANARDASGHALFGGESAVSAYQRDASGNAVYVGTPSAGELPLGEGQSVTRSLTGPEVLGLTVNGAPSDLLAVVRDLADALKPGGSATPAAAAGAALDALASGIDQITTAQTVVGTRLAWIDLTTQRATDLSETRASEEADVGGTDIATAVTQLQEAMTVLEASQASFTRLASLSLFDQLR